MMKVKASTTDIYDLTPIQVQDRAAMKHTISKASPYEMYGEIFDWL